MNRIGYRMSYGIGKQGGFSTVAMAAALAFVVNTAFGVVLLGGSTAGERSYRSNGNGDSTMVASATAALRKACAKV